MKDTVTQLTALLRRVTLTRSEKDFMRASLLSYMQMKPLRASAPVGTLASFSPFSLRPLFSKAVPVALVAVMAATGVAFAAGDALPGETLYGVKVNVLEKVQTAVAVGTEAEAKVQAELATKRLKEAQQLAVRGELTSETQAQIETRFKEHAGKVEERLAQVEQTQGTEAAVKLSAAVEASFQAHGDILEKLSEGTDPARKSEIAALVGQIKAVVTRVGESGHRIEAQITESTDPEEVRRVVEEKQRDAEQAIMETETYFNKKRELFSKRVQTDMTNKLELARQTVDAGKERVTEDKFLDAYLLFKVAQESVREGKIALEVALELNVEVGTNGSGTATSTDPGTQETGTSTSDGSGTGTTTEQEGGVSSPIQTINNTVKNLGR